MCAATSAYDLGMAIAEYFRRVRAGDKAIRFSRVPSNSHLAEFRPLWGWRLYNVYGKAPGCVWGVKGSTSAGHCVVCRKHLCCGTDCESFNKTTDGEQSHGDYPRQRTPWRYLAYYLGVFSLIPCFGLVLGMPAVLFGISRHLGRPTGIPKSKARAMPSPGWCSASSRRSCGLG